jgi:prophage tail gpP-like protein
LLGCDGEAYALPAPVSWRVVRTGSVPCDEMELCCPWDGEGLEALRRCDRFVVYEGDAVMLTGVVDEYEARVTQTGRFLTVTGRGMMARLLDNEAEAVSYQKLTVDELLRRHAAGWGINWQKTDKGSRGGSWEVRSGESQWSVISGFCRSVLGYEPYMTALGELVVAPLRGSGEELRLGEGILSCTLRDKRYGVISEMLVKNKGGDGVRVVNEPFRQRGGQRRQVLYMPRRSSRSAMRYTGQYQIEQSMDGAKQVEVTLPGGFLAQCGDKVTLAYEPMKLYGRYHVVQAESRGSEKGTTTTLLLEELTDVDG